VGITAGSRGGIGRNGRDKRQHNDDDDDDDDDHDDNNNNKMSPIS
jgi:hypothetical protein